MNEIQIYKQIFPFNYFLIGKSKNKDFCLIGRGKIQAFVNFLSGQKVVK